VRLRIEDQERRWALLLGDDSSTRLTSACAVEGGIVRARIGAGGTLDLQRITSPLNTAQWQAWATLVSGVATTSDVAISTLDGDPSRVRLFFARPDSGSYTISWVQSADAGQAWSAPSALVTDLPAPGASLASANGQLLYHDARDGYLKLALRASWEGGPWEIRPWLAGGALPTRHGVAAGFASGRYHVASCDEEAPGVCRLRSGTHTPFTASWSAPVAIVPPGSPAASFIPKYPSLVRAGELWHLAYLETCSGVLAYAEPTVIHSPDWEHWSFTSWVPLPAFGERRRAVIIHHDAALYLAVEYAVRRTSAYTPTDGDRHLTTSDLLGYVVEEGPWRGRALVEIHNRGGRYDGFGQPGTPGGAIQPLARVVIERGFRTVAGEERVERPPYYLISAALRRGGARPCLRLECEDGWGLLRRWRPDALCAWSGKTLAWLIAEVLYRAAGLTCTFDGATAWGTVLDAFVIAPSSEDGTLRGTGLAALRTLLAKAAARARWQADGSLFCFVPWAQAIADPYVVGAGGEVLDALYGRGLVMPTEARVFGEGVAGVAAALDAPTSSRRYLATRVDPHLTTVAECSGRAAGLAHAGQARAHLGWVETPCQCSLDLYDLVTIADPHAGGLSSIPLRVAGIVERYEPSAGLFTTRATLEGA
jgi:hypothetical protein